MVWILLMITAFAPSLVTAADGCGWGQSKCGDKCIEGGEYSYCHCGNDTLTIPGHSNHDWLCCAPTGTCTETEWGNVTCPSGTVQSLTQPCLGKCNYWPDDPFNAFRSYKMCNATVNMDIQNNTQCVWESKFENNEYDCLDRSDEKTLNVKKSEIKVFSNLTTCEFQDEYSVGPGLSCSDYPSSCLPYSRWCIPEEPFKCPKELGTILSQDPDLCSNYTFWSDRPCYFTGHGEGKRCTGSNSGQCVFPQSSYGDVKRSCADKSDQVHSVNTTCPVFLEDDHPHCSEELWQYCSFSEYSGKYKVYSGYDQYWSDCLSCFDPSNCAGSCAIPSPTSVPANYSRDLHQHCRSGF